VTVLFMPAGDPAALEEAAGTLRSYASQVASLGTSTRSTTGQIASGADWTGASADNYTQFTSSFAAGMEGMEQPLRRVPGAVAAYAAALRNAQAKVADYQSFARQVNEMSGPFSPQQAAEIEAEVQTRMSTAETSLVVLDQAAREAESGLKAIGRLLDDLFGSESTFHQWLENTTRPWDSAGADEILEQVLQHGETAEEEFEKGAKAVEKAQKALEAALNSDLEDIVEAVMKDMLQGKAGVADLRNAAENWKVAAQWATEAASQGGALDLPQKTALIKFLPYLQGLGRAADVLGVIGGTYTVVSPPEYDEGGARAAARFAGGALAVGSAAGLAGSFGLLSGAVLGSLTIPGVGEAVAAAAGLYLVGDWAYHNTHAIAHTFDSARHTAAHYADDLVSWL
jgi:uncharacterized protein YukE